MKTKREALKERLFLAGKTVSMIVISSNRNPKKISLIYDLTIHGVSSFTNRPFYRAVSIEKRLLRNQGYRISDRIF